jgi:hypothetical protein
MRSDGGRTNVRPAVPGCGLFHLAAPRRNGYRAVVKNVMKPRTARNRANGPSAFHLCEFSCIRAPDGLRAARH